MEPSYCTVTFFLVEQHAKLLIWAMHLMVQNKNNDTMENGKDVWGIEFIFKFGILRKQLLRRRVETPLNNAKLKLKSLAVFQIH